ncbi:glycosyltransferase family 4 protein [Nonomuraea soli]|uniref:Glycosyltransferase involved in cell wall biosynthesis n=1 Tax=Nonomuraea soli TaxID=1032476 RepID=A0A7W0HUL9_9ACTN|nr:glycosyltransferase family 4 protein [Nonomuraea soli]MBA2895931.1 glycosyltransferase involved in cell wall biosynthesis [Nonomuraea soli]
MGESLRVALVLGTTSGGTGRHVRMLAAGLARHGHRVVVIGPRSTEESFDFTGAGARFVEVPVSDRPHPVNDARAVAAMRRATREADVVHAHGLRAGALAALALVGGRARLVVTLHNALTASGAIGAVYGVLERIVARRADLVLGVSRDLTERMTALGAREVGLAVVPAPPLRPVTRPAAEVRAELLRGNGAVDPAAGVPGGTAPGGTAPGGTAPGGTTPGGAQADGAGSGPSGSGLAGSGRASSGLAGADAAGSGAAGSGAAGSGAAGSGGAGSSPASSGGDSSGDTASGDTAPRVGAAAAREGAERPIVLSNVRLAQQKGLDLLLDAARGPWPEPAPLFVIAGDGPLREELQRRIDAEHLPVRLLGWRDDVPDLLAAADVALWPSRWEGQPLSMSEALMAGVPVVATEVGGIPDLLAGAGLLVPYGDAAAMGRAVQQALRRREGLARASAERGSALPDERAAIDAVLTVYPVRGR